MNRTVNLGLIQMSCSENIDENFEKTINLIRDAAQQGAQIVCTQELFKTRYFCQSEDWRHFELAEEINRDSEMVRVLGEIANELQIVLIASLFEKRAVGLCHNTAVVLDADGSYLGKYRKMHIPDDPHYYEKFYFTPGDLGYKVFHTQYADIGVLICWDQWFPEAARILALQGVEIIVILTAIGYSNTLEELSYDHAWRTVQQGHAVANACFLAAVNRVGFEEDPSILMPASQQNISDIGPTGENGINFWGQSFVVDPDGIILKQAGKDEDEILICEVDLTMVDDTKKHFSFPYRDRRVDSYPELLRKYID